MRREDKIPAVELSPSVEMTPQFKREWDKPVLRALTVQFQKQVIKVHVRPSQSHRFTATGAGVNEHENENVKPCPVKILRLPLRKLLDVFNGECGQDALLFFHAGHLERKSRPSQVSIHSANAAVA